MLGGVVAEAVRAAGDALVEIGDEVVLEVRVLRVHVGQAPHLAGGALQPVVPVGNLLEAAGVVEVLRPPHGIQQILADALQGGGGVVWNHVHDHLHAVPVGLLAHSGELLLGAQLVVADGPVRGLVVVVPLPLAVELHAAVPAHHARVGRGGLHGGVPGPGDVLHALGDRGEGPAPGVENRAVLNTLRQAVGIAGPAGRSACGLPAAGVRTPGQRRRQKKRKKKGQGPSGERYHMYTVLLAVIFSIMPQASAQIKGPPHGRPALRFLRAGRPLLGQSLPEGP